MAANEVNIRVNVATRDAEKQIGGLKKSFTSLLAPLKSIGGLLGVAGGLGGLFLMGRSFIQTALSAGAGSRALWRFQEASFELRRTLGELLLKALGPVMNAMSKFFGIISKAVSAIDVFIWRNWETVLEGIRGGLSSLDRITGGFGSTLAEVTRKFKDQGGIVAVTSALWDRWGNNIEIIGGLLGFFSKKLNETNTSSLESIPIVGDLIKGFKHISQELDKLNKDEQFSWVEAILKATKAVDPIQQINDALQELKQSPAEGSIWDKVFGGERGDLQRRLDEDSAVLNEAGTMFIAVPKRIEEESVPIWQRMGDKIHEVNTAFWDKTLSLTKTTGKAIGKAFMSAFNVMKDWFVNTGWPAFSGFWVNSWNTAKKFFVLLWEIISAKASEIWNGIETVAKDVFGRIVSFIQGVWSTVKGIVDSILAAVARAKAAASSVGGRFFGGILNRAAGGPASGLTLVGERGPELLDLPGGSNVIPNHRIAGTTGAGRGAGLTVNYHQNAPVYGFIDFANEVNQVVRDALLTGGYRDVLA